MKTGSFIVHFISMLILILMASCSEDPPTESQLTVDQQLQKALNDAIREYGGKGVSAAVIFPDGRVWQGAAGISHGNKAITTGTLFSAGSITKSFTAVAIMKMVEDSMLSLEEPVHKFFPVYANIDTTVTIRELLNHTSGIYNVTANPLFWADIFNDPAREWTADDVLNNYVLEPYFPRGTNWHYCNTGYIMLRKLITDLNGTPISQVYRSRILDPLQLTSTFLYTEENLPVPMAHGWMDLNSDQIYDDLTVISPVSFYSAAGGGIFATARDLALWAKYIFIDQTAVSPGQLTEMMDFYTPVPGEPLVAGYGLGLVHFNPDLFNGLTVYGHSGDAPGYTAASLFLADYNVCLGIADNTEDGDTMWVITDLLTIITDHLDE